MSGIEGAMDFDRHVRERLVRLGLELPVPPPPAGSYDPFILDRGTGYLSAQVPPKAHAVATGRVGAELTPEQGYEAARLAALNALARIDQALRGFDRLRTLLRVEGHVASIDSFRDQPRVVDGASELFLAVLGERGKHARTAFAPARLPWDVSIELAITFSYEDT